MSVIRGNLDMSSLNLNSDRTVSCIRRLLTPEALALALAWFHFTNVVAQYKWSVRIYKPICMYVYKHKYIFIQVYTCLYKRI